MPAVNALLVFAVLALLTGSCGDDSTPSDASAENEVRKQLNEWVAAMQTADAERYLAHVTENWLETVHDTTADEIRANPAESLGGGTLTIGNIRVSGKTATVEIELGPEGILTYTQNVEAIKKGDTWKVDRPYAASAETIPADVKKVEVELDEWSIRFDEHQMTGDSQLVLQVKNRGTEPHMLVLSIIAKEANLRQLLELEEPDPQLKPQSKEELGAAFFFGPGDPVAEVVITEKLAPGRYVFVCWVTSPGESVPHVAKEMFAEFTVE